MTLDGNVSRPASSLNGGGRDRSDAFRDSLKGAKHNIKNSIQVFKLNFNLKFRLYYEYLVSVLI